MTDRSYLPSSKLPPERNMYGCTPCPSCGGVHRYPFHKNGRAVIECGDCDRVAPWSGEFGDDGYSVDEVFERCPAGNAACDGRHPSTSGSIENYNGLQRCRVCRKPARKGEPCR